MRDPGIEQLEADMDRLRAEGRQTEAWLASRARRAWLRFEASQPIQKIQSVPSGLLWRYAALYSAVGLAAYVLIRSL